MARKNKAKKIIRMVSVLLFLAVLILPQLSWLIIKAACGNNQDVMDRLDYDLGENRELASMPDGSNFAGITAEFDSYYNDHAPYRSILITINRRINSRLERAYSSKVQPVLVALIENKNNAAAKKNAAENTTETSGMDYAGETGKNTPENIAESTSENTSETASGNKSESTSETASGNKSENTSEGTSENTSKAPSEGENASASEGQAQGEAQNEAESKKDGVTDVSEPTNEQPSTDVAGENPGYLPPRELNGTVFGRDDWMFCNYDNSIGYYCGTNIMSEQQMKDKLTLMNRLQQICDSRGIQLEFMIAPNKEQVYSEYMPTYTIENTYKRVPRFVDYVRQNSSVKIIYPIEELRAAKATMSTYYKYDSHWNHYGSFIATQALYKDMGLDFVEPDSVTYTEEGCIWGLVITAGLSWQDYERDYDHVANYRPEVELFNTDGEINIIHTEKSAVYRTDSTAANDSNFVMIGDSFRLYMMPYLERDFSHVSIAHRDNVQDLADDIRNADILVIECVERLDDSLNGTLIQIINILEAQQQ